MKNFSPILRFENDCLMLKDEALFFQQPFFVEFNPQRYQQPAKELLIKAIGAKKSALPTVCDLTAGFGQDAYLIHRYGCEIQLVERSPIIAHLLQDGLRRFHCNLPLFIGEAQDFIKQCLDKKNYYDVVYFDPIFPPKAKNALSNKAARLLRELAGENHDAAEIFLLAQKIARKRLVIKRPRYADVIFPDVKPDVIYKGKSVRFDVYIER